MQTLFISVGLFVLSISSVIGYPAKSHHDLNYKRPNMDNYYNLRYTDTGSSSPPGSKKESPSFLGDDDEELNRDKNHALFRARREIMDRQLYTSGFHHNPERFHQPSFRQHHQHHQPSFSHHQHQPGFGHNHQHQTYNHHHSQHNPDYHHISYGR